MALAPSGAESPSAAFLAGQQHGAALAVQHHAAASKPAPKPAAPTKKPAAPVAQTAPGQVDLGSLYKQAQALAQAQTAAQIKAIQQQQQLYTQQGQDRASQVNAVAQAAAQMLSGLGDQTSSSYTDAAKALGGLGAGFTGQAATDATNAADQVRAQLAANGAPAAGLKTSTGQTINPADLQSALYGLHAFIPGNLLLTSGQAAADTARALPGSVLANGQNQAAGTLAAAQDKADTLTPQILSAQGNLPSLTGSAYNNLLNGVFKQAGLNVSLQKLADAEQNQKFTQGFKQQQQNDLNSYRQTQVDLRQAGLRLQSQKQQDALAKAVATGMRPNAALSKLYGHIVDENGNPITDAAGKPITVTATSGAKPLSAATISKLSGDAALIASNTLNGFTDAKGGKHPPLNFGQALNEMRKGTGDGQIPLPIALKEMRQAGWKIPGKYNKIMGGSPSQGVPFATNAPADWRVATGPEGAGGVWAPPWNQTLTPAQRVGVAERALAYVSPGLATSSNVAALVGRINQESGGQTAVVNKWDSNWQKGVPSIGLLQTIGPTFDTYKAPGHGNIWDPVDNAIAAVRYMLTKYGRIVGPSGTGY